jgi:N-acetylneuraminic acid mutarotase
MKRILLLTFLISFGVANAQGVWTQKADIPIAAYKQGGAAFSIAGKGYIGAGFNGGSNTNDFWEYNPANNVWTQKAAFPGVIRKWLVGFSIGNKGYMGLGYNGTAFNDFYEYDPATDTWTQLGNFPGTLRYSCVSFVIGGKAYISTGKNTSSSASSETWEYDPSTDLWTQKANMAGGSRNDAIGFAIGNYGYVGAGYNGYNKTDFWQFDPIANTWLQKANCIYGGYSCSAFSIDTLGYFYNGLATSPNFYCYSPSSNTWT